MMSTIVEEKLISFKELEQKVFKYVCELGCEITRIILDIPAFLQHGARGSKGGL